MKNNSRSAGRRAAVLGLLSPLLLATPAQAQTAPSAGEVLRELQPRTPPVEPARPRPRLDAPAPPPPLALLGGQTLHVERFRLEGDDLLPADELLARLDDLRGRDLDFGQIRQAAARITTAYRQAGYPMATAVVPRQELADDTLVIHVTAGRVGKVTVRNASRAPDRLATAPFTDLGGDYLRRADAERAALLVDALPGAGLPTLTAQASADAPGASDLLVEVPAEPRFGGFLLADTNGSASTGRNRVSGGARANSLLGLGERLVAAGVVGIGGRALAGAVGGTVPLTSDGLTLGFTYTKINYELGGAYNGLGASGDSWQREVMLDQPLLLTRDSRAGLRATLASRHLVDRTASLDVETPKQSQSGTLQFDWEDWSPLDGKPARRNLRLAATQGHLTIDDPVQKRLDQRGPDTTGVFGHLNGRLGGSYGFVPGWQLAGAVSGQKALRRKNLNPLDQFALTGSDGVRAYREWVSGDTGWLLTGLVRRDLPGLDASPHWIVVFMDTGRVNAQRAWQRGSNGTRLTDAGLVWHLEWKNAVTELAWARALGPEQPAVATQGRQRLMFQAGITF